MLHASLRLFRVHSIALLAVAMGAALLPVRFAAAQGKALVRRRKHPVGGALIGLLENGIGHWSADFFEG